MQLKQIAENLKDSYDYFMVPKAVLNVPIQLGGMAKEDEEGKLTGEYYSINEIHDALGNQFTFVPVVDDRFVAFRWAVDWDGTDSVIAGYLKANDLVDIRDDGVGGRLKVEDIDFTNLPDNGFALFSTLAFKQVLKDHKFSEEPQIN